MGGGFGFPDDVLLGYDSNQSRLVASGSSSPQSIEEYLLKFRTSFWQRFVAKYFQLRIQLGIFKKVDHASHTCWFLFWCFMCSRFQVNYREGFDYHLVCRFCREHYQLNPGSKAYLDWSRSIALPKDYKVFR